ncbi:MAG: serine/threonine protein kinase [Myxococcales bacterium]|nr:serine/threonine protein kinase [Myxococcales bacterium]
METKEDSELDRFLRSLLRPGDGEEIEELEPGTLLPGGYQLSLRLGRGGMGIVYAATRDGDDRRYAVKILPQCDPGSLEVARFVREAKVVRELRHESIVCVCDFGFVGNRPYLVMERLSGETLGRWMAREERTTPSIAWRLLTPVAEALMHAHAQGIVHRDVKPENVFLVRSTHPVGGSSQAEVVDRDRTEVGTGAGRVGDRDSSLGPSRPATSSRAKARASARVLPRAKLLDFGIAKLVEPASDVLTRSGIRLGTPAYMAPEQITSSRTVGPSCDQYALAVVLFELVGGALPHGGVSADVMLAVKVDTPPRDLGELAPEAPPAFQDAVMRGLCVDPADRFRDVGEFWSAVGRAIRAAPLALRGD